MKLPESEEALPIGFSSASTSNRFEDDRFLRLHGWCIHARPRHGPAMWKKDGGVLPEQAALAMTRREQDEQLELMASEE